MNARKAFAEHGLDDALTKELEKKLSPEALSGLALWLTDDNYSAYVTQTLELLKSKNYKDLEDAFYKHIEIGTGGIRGPLGVGPNRINLRIIGEAAQGLSQFIADFGEEAKKKGVVVGHEARKQSVPFAQLCCSVFAANGIKSYLFDGLRATPEISFAVRHLGAVAGVQLTASHNPRTDNGFKFYWTDGGQVVPPLDLKYMELVANVTAVPSLGFEEAKSKGLIEVIGKDVDKAYLDAINGLSLASSRSADIVFSPIHGAGSTNVLPVLQEQGFSIEVVKEQAEPDENFPTATGDLINPEYEEVMELPMSLGERKGADLVINSDPDADRIGVASKKQSNSNEVQFLTGNEVGIAMTYFILDTLSKRGDLTSNSLVIETYVTTTLISDIAREFKVKVVDDLLVGFKFIGEVIEKLDNKNDFIFAAEESLGYLRGTFVRDKDAAISAFTLAELASSLKDEGKTIVNYLDEIYEKYSYYKNILNMQEMYGRKGFENRDKIMKHLRADPPTEFGGLKVLKIIDRLPEAKRDPSVYVCGATGDQLTFVLSDNEKTKITARPSGTEPKMKYYIQHQKKPRENLEATKAEVDKQAKLIETDILSLQEEIIK